MDEESRKSFAGNPMVGLAGLLALACIAIASTRDASPAFAVGLVLGQLGVSAVMALPFVLLWRFLSVKGRLTPTTMVLNAYCILTAVIWLLLFVLLRTLLSHYVPLLATNSRGQMNTAGDVSISAAAENSPQRFSLEVQSTQAQPEQRQPATSSVDLRGVRSCGKWLNERLSGNSKWGETWLLGYLSGSAMSSGRDILKGTDNASILYQMDAFCKTNPLRDVADGAEEIIAELTKVARP